MDTVSLCFVVKKQRFREVDWLFLGLKVHNRMGWDLRLVLPGSQVPCSFHWTELSLIHFSTHLGDNNGNQELTNLSLFPTAAASSDPYCHLPQRGCLLALAVYKESGEENDSWAHLCRADGISWRKRFCAGAKKQMGQPLRIRWCKVANSMKINLESHQQGFIKLLLCSCSRATEYNRRNTGHKEKVIMKTNK